MLSSSLRLKRAVVNYGTKSQMNLELHCGKAFDPDALCPRRSAYCDTGWVKIWVFRKGIFSTCTEGEKKFLLA